MSDLLFNHDKAVADWVGERCGKAFEPPYAAFGVMKSGKLTGGFVFNGFTGSSIEISLAGPGVVCRSSWAAVLDYTFRQLNVSRLQAHTSRRNKTVKRQISRLGFKFEGVARRYYGKDDAVVYALTADDLPAFRQKWGI